MSDTFFEELSIPKPTHNLHISGGGHGEMTGRMLIGLERVMLDENPDAVVVFGDTNSTVAGALSAVKLHIPIVHIEAGLRSFNRRMPEEINRIMTDHVSSLLLCPTKNSVQNLNDEGIVKGVHHVGDVMYDATLYAKENAARYSTILEDLNLRETQFTLATIHRAENTNTAEKLEKIIQFLRDIAKDSPVILPLHPRTKGVLEKHRIGLEGITIIEPIGYFNMHRLLGAASNVVTDSGGIQKEAYFHGIPCITVRDETEWVETIEHGWNRLWQDTTYHKPKRSISDYGRGDAADICVQQIFEFLQN